jgi:hypothetical protein
VSSLIYYNTVFPEFTAQPSNEPTDPIEMLYLINRTDTATIDPAAPNSYYASYKTPSSTYFNGVIDQWGVYFSDPARFDADLASGPTQGLTSSPVEGLWYAHAALRNAASAGSPVTTVPYIVDITPPTKVTGVGVFADVATTTPISGWLRNQSRVVIRWDGQAVGGLDYDRLSKTHHFNVYVDGVLLDKDGIVAEPGRALMSVTIEDLLQGWHKVEITAVDNAGNEGPRSAPAYVGVDFMDPTVQITSPAAGGYAGVNSVVSAQGIDNVGVASVQFQVDGVPVGTAFPPAGVFLTSYNGSVLPNWAAFADGTHMLTVRVNDFSGRSATSSRSFILDKTPPVISYVSGAPSPFYPRLREGYKDNFYVRFRSSETVVATVVIRNSLGKVVKTISKSVAAGSNYIVWNGKDSSGAVRAGTYRWSVYLKDRAGNVSATRGGTTYIRFYELVRVNASTVRIIPR